MIVICFQKKIIESTEVDKAKEGGELDYKHEKDRIKIMPVLVFLAAIALRVILFFRRFAMSVRNEFHICC